MKLLRITAEGLPLFKEKLDLTFYAQQRIAEEQKSILYPLFSNIYLSFLECSIFIIYFLHGILNIINELAGQSTLNVLPIPDNSEIFGTTLKGVLKLFSSNRSFAPNTILVPFEAISIAFSNCTLTFQFPDSAFTNLTMISLRSLS